MQPGPIYIFKCPQCGLCISRFSLMSGNNFRSKLYSDLREIAPMLPESPRLTKCYGCNTIIWLTKLKPIKKIDPFINYNFKNIAPAKFLDIDDCFRALHEGLASDAKDEIYIRTQIWWAYNDRVRKEIEMFRDDEDKTLWRENCIRLIELSDPTDHIQKLIIAELHRTMGRFDDCILMLKNIRPDYNWIAKKLIAECRIKNTEVFQLR